MKAGLTLLNFVFSAVFSTIFSTVPFGVAMASSPPQNSFEFRAMPRDFKQQEGAPGKEQIENLEAAEIFALHQSLEDAGLAGANKNFANGADIFGVDQIFSSQHSKKIVLLKLNLKSTQDEHLGKVLTHQNDFYFHAATPSGFPFVLYFSDFKADELRSLLAKITYDLDQASNNYKQASHSPNIRKSLFSKFSIYNQACAGSSHPFYNNPGQSTHSTRKPLFGSSKNDPPEATSTSTNKSDKAETIVANVGACLKGLGRGVYNSTIGSVFSIVEGAIRLVKGTAWALTHPTQFWQEAKKSFQRLTAAIKGFSLDKAFQKLKGKHAKMNSLEKTNFVCWLIGVVGTNVALWYFLPANIDKLGTKIKEYYDNASRGHKLQNIVSPPPPKFPKINKKY